MNPTSVENNDSGLLRLVCIWIGVSIRSFDRWVSSVMMQRNPTFLKGPEPTGSMFLKTTRLDSGLDLEAEKAGTIAFAIAQIPTQP